MNAHPVFETVRARFQAGLKTRILAFGSSNTEHFLPGMHWFDVLDLAVCHRYGRIHTCINTGIGGNTSADLLERFDEDAAAYAPHLVFITIGGNDSAPWRSLDERQFAENLRTLYRRFWRLGTAVVFQTYYAPVDEWCDASHLKRFYPYMDIIRHVAADTKAGLIDHLARWERLRQNHRERFLPLMQDGLHVNRRGNMVIGLDVARAFDARPNIPGAFSDHDADGKTFWNEAVEIQALMDR